MLVRALREPNRAIGRWRVIASAALLLTLVAPAVPVGHEIPTDVTVQALVRPEGQTLHVIVRVPLLAMRDVTFPLRGPGFLDLPRADPALREAATIWVGRGIEVFENDLPVDAGRITNVRVSLPSDRSFSSYQQARDHVTGPPLPADTNLIWDQALLDALVEFPIGSERSNFSLRMGFERLGLRVSTALRFVPPGGPERAFNYSGDPGIVRLDPHWHQAAFSFVRLGFTHILEGTDHLLFLFCLVIPLRRIRPLILVVTSFTAAHSITLIASAYGVTPDALWFPAFVETLIAMSIVYMALENIIKGWGSAPHPGSVAGGDPGAPRRSLAGAPCAPGRNVERRWIITFGFGLVHGFGFSFALSESLQFAGSHLLISLLSFNIGVELGQLLVLAFLVPALYFAFRYAIPERMGTIILSAIVAHTGWHWMTDRGSTLLAYELPVLDAASILRVLWWAVLAVTAGWALATLRERRSKKTGETSNVEL